MQLGGGRAAKEDAIDLSVGVVLGKKVGERIARGESLGTIHARTEEAAKAAAESLRKCFSLSPAPVTPGALIKGIVR